MLEVVRSCLNSFNNFSLFLSISCCMFGAVLKVSKVSSSFCVKYALLKEYPKSVLSLDNTASIARARSMASSKSRNAAAAIAV